MRLNSKKLGIVIVNYNNWPDTVKVLQDLDKNDKTVDFQVVVIDNASRNQNELSDKVKQLSLTYKLKLKLNTVNVGFARAVNYGLDYFYKKNYDYFLVLNNDTSLGVGFIKCLMDKYQTLPSGSILSPVIKHHVGDRVLYGGEGYINPLLALAKHRNYRSLKGLRGCKKVEFVSGCCMMFDRVLLDNGVWFDKGFFLYLEDVDFCLQAKKKGFDSYLCFDCVLYHKQSRSFKDPVDKLKYSFVSNLKFGWKNYKSFIWMWGWFLPLFYFYLYLLWSKQKLKKL